MSTKKTFEDSLKELEEVAIKLETGNLGLDEAIEEFEKGMKLSKECTKKLDEAENLLNKLRIRLGDDDQDVISAQIALNLEKM